jgi:putative transposase
MGRPPRTSEGGVIYHVLNRANARISIFEKDADYAAFERILHEAVERFEMRLLTYCLMPNHWHQILWPARDGELSHFVGWLTLTHTQRWHANRRTAGSGHVYQGRFKSFPVQNDEHFLTVCRYVERNALRAGLVSRAEQWRWGSLWRYVYGTWQKNALLGAWPIPRTHRWIEYVNTPQTESELNAIRCCVQRGRPFGEDRWTKRTVAGFGLETTIRPHGRPRRAEKGS